MKPKSRRTARYVATHAVRKDSAEKLLLLYANLTMVDMETVEEVAAKIAKAIAQNDDLEKEFEPQPLNKASRLMVTAAMSRLWLRIAVIKGWPTHQHAIEATKAYNAWRTHMASHPEAALSPKLEVAKPWCNTTPVFISRFLADTASSELGPHQKALLQRYA